MDFILVLLGLIVAVIGVILMIASGRDGDSKTGKYKARQLMTANEAEFFGRLVAAFPEHYIFPQVAMSALIEAATEDKKKAHSDRLRVAQQRVDYAVCDKNCKLIAVVELDDRTHSSDKDKRRDERLLQAGLRTVRFQSKSKPDIEALRKAILSVAVAAEMPCNA